MIGPWPGTTFSTRAIGDVETPGHGQRLQRAKPERHRAIDGELFVEGAQGSLRLPGARGQTPRGALRAAERETREGEAPEQVVPVAVGRQQTAGRRELRLREQRREGLQLFWENGRVDHKRLPLARGVAAYRSHRHAVQLQQRARDDEHVAVQRLGAHRG